VRAGYDDAPVRIAYRAPVRTPAKGRFFGTLVLVRRGPIDASWDGKVLGQEDPPLAPAAASRERTLLERLAELRPDRIVSSDLDRACATAERLAERSRAPLAVRSELREQRFGRWQGRAWAELVASDPDAVSFLGSFTSARPPGGEDLGRVQERAVRAIGIECRRVHRRVIVAIAHAGPIRGIVAKALGLPLELAQRLQLDPFGVTVLRMQGEAATLSHLNLPLDGEALRGAT
jgi:probable phosphoglycerate mutase